METTERPHSSHQYSTTSLSIGVIAALLVLPILMESVCLGILYVNEFLKGRDTSSFAVKHLLTRQFISAPPSPVSGKKFLGVLDWDNEEPWLQFAVADDLLGWRLAADISVFESPVPSGKYLYITDHNGFIVDVDDPPITLQKSVGTYRVIVLGASTVVGLGAPRPSQNIVGMLRKGVQERGLTGPDGTRVELINAGVNGYNSAQEYLYLVSDLLRFKPDLVVVYDGGIDSRYNFKHSFSPFRTSTHDEIQSRIQRSYSIAGSASLFADNLELGKLGMVELPRRLFDKLRSKPNTARSISTSGDPPNVKFYDINRRAFLALADDQLSVALFLQPLFGVDGRTLSAEEKSSLGNRVLFYERARQVIADLKARDEDSRHHCVADLSDSLKGVSEPVYVDDEHLLPKGNEVVAAHILDRLILCGFLRESRIRRVIDVRDRRDF
jgi:hypothetical protein